MSSEIDTILIISDKLTARELEQILKPRLETLDGLSLEVHNDIDANSRGLESFPPEVLAAIIGGGVTLLTTCLSLLVTSIVDIWSKEREAQHQMIVVKSKGNEIQFPADASEEQIQSLMKKVEQLGKINQIVIIEDE